MTIEQTPEPSEGPKRHRRLGLVIPWAFFALLALGWTLYWFMLAAAARAQFDAAVDAQRARGAEIHIGAMETRGFPLQLALDLRDVSYISQDGAWRAATPHLLIHVNPANPSHLIATLPSPIDAARENRPHRIAADGLRVSLRMKGGRLAQAGVAAEHLNVFDLTDQASDYDIEAFVLNARPDPRDAQSLQMSLNMQGAVVREPPAGLDNLGVRIETLNAAIVGEKAIAQGNIGAMRVEALRLVWGPLTATGDGALTRGEDGRIDGALRLRAEHPSPWIAGMGNGGAEIPLRVEDDKIYKDDVRE